ncbi:MAG: HdeD family acid-resistance protein [Gammaproteobacteria bacterium]
MDHFTTQQHVGRNSAFLVINGGLLAMLGFIAAVSPLAAGLPPAMVVGLMLISRASMQFYYGIKVRHWGYGIGSYMGLGSILMSFVSVSCGALLMFNSFSNLEYMTLLLTMYLILIGGFDIMHAIELREVDGWQYILLNGFVGLILGAMIWYQWPLSGRWAIGALAGLSLMLSGLSQVGLGMAGRNFLIRSRVHPLAGQQA